MKNLNFVVSLLCALSAICFAFYHLPDIPGSQLVMGGFGFGLVCGLTAADYLSENYLP